MRSCLRSADVFFFQIQGGLVLDFFFGCDYFNQQLFGEISDSGEG